MAFDRQSALRNSAMLWSRLNFIDRIIRKVTLRYRITLKMAMPSNFSSVIII
jgi:hypothetical protein